MIKIDSPAVMGIINITRDSFFEGSRCCSENEAGDMVNQMLSEGADIIDIGACSTRPGSESVSEPEEWRALEPVMKMIKSSFPGICISVDTFRSSIVKKCADTFGEIIINDISAGEDDPKMLETAASYGFTYIAMHKRGTPAVMQQYCNYNDVAGDVAEYFSDFLKKAETAGLPDIIIDPGFGFSKTIEQNYELLNGLGRLNMEYNGKRVPVLAGLSRKSMIYKLLGTTPAESLPATSALNLIALQNGADIIRVHDVKEGRNVVTIFHALDRNRKI
jgi:dihydropteroate synthase